MKAMILAAGLGTRMRPLTNHTPKPLLMVGGKPLIVWHIEKLARLGIQDIIINIAWLGWKIPEALGNGERWQVNLHYSDEQQETALETAGGIIKALPLLGTAPFLVVNGDIWCQHNLQLPTLTNHDLAHLVLVPNPAYKAQGDFSLQQQRIHNTGEPNYTFSGIGLYHPDLFNTLAYGKQPLAPLLRHAADQHRISGELFTGDWHDIGTPERLQALNTALNTNPPAPKCEES